MAGRKVMEALQLHKKGLNCAQSVALPFCEELGMDKASAMKSLEGFGFGMGGSGSVCGALTGAVFVAGLKNSCGDLENPKSKGSTYKITKQLFEDFTNECGSNLCPEIKGKGTGKVLKTCDECVFIAASLAEKIVYEK